MTLHALQLIRKGALQLHADDNVLIALRELAIGTTISEHRVTVLDRVPVGHKVAYRAINAGEPVRRYGQIIGVATCAICVGQHVHSHNLGMGDFPRSAPTTIERTEKRSDAIAFFDGILRPDGSVATRNYIGILSTVNCSATVAHAIARHFQTPTVAAENPLIDGVVAFTHGSGCGMSTVGEGIDILRRTIMGYAAHPNIAGILIVGLGCESNQIAQLLRSQSIKHPRPVATMNIQDVGGTARCIDWGVAQVREMLEEASHVHRVPVPASHLKVGLQCGGSDGLSGITANPALGAAVDRLVAQGGTAVLSETPEIYGAEHLLTARAARPEVAQKLLDRITWWESYCARHGGEMNNNPTPGNKAGGLTTILEKSLGAVAKAGTTELRAVYDYAEPISERGLVFMDSPGFDPVSATGQVASGCNLICFTTGRGSAYGCIPAPSIKIATNSALYQRQSDDMDLNAGEVLEGLPTIQMGERIFSAMLSVASGTKSRSETYGYGRHEFAPWSIGAVM